MRIWNQDVNTKILKHIHHREGYFISYRKYSDSADFSKYRNAITMYQPIIKGKLDSCLKALEHISTDNFMLTMCFHST